MNFEEWWKTEGKFMFIGVGGYNEKVIAEATWQVCKKEVLKIIDENFFDIAPLDVECIEKKIHKI